jgi:UDP-N-acetylmuramate: L-alanyl-gamma-D-glutamyl-meso-diaminopimelate ligase
MHIHILGICGTFMGGVAALAREAGHTVTGCDAGVYPPMSDQLRALGIELIEGFGTEQLALKPDVYVVGNVVSRARLPDGTPKFPLMEAIMDRGLPYTSGPQWLAEHVLQGRHVLAVAGTHGKTTTTSMLAWILEHAGLQPGFLVGGVPLNFGVSARLGGGAVSRHGVVNGGGAGQDLVSCPPPALRAPPLPTPNPALPHLAQLPGERADVRRAGPSQASTAPSGGSEDTPVPSVGATFVIEADEYDTAFFDKRSKFVHYRPRTAVLNNLEFDHADIFDDLAAIERQFHHLVRTVPSSGRVVVNGLEESLARVVHAGCWSELRSFGTAVSDFSAVGEPHDFEVLQGGKPVAHVRWGLNGVHNQLNALAAIAAAEHVGVSPQAAAKALGEFQNVKRRMEVRGKVGGVTVLDDFAHHPTAIRTTVDGLRRTLPAGQRILAVFEPRSNTMKLGTMKSQLPWSLEQADLAFCHSGGLGWDATEALAPMGARCVVADNIADLVDAVIAAAQPGDHILCMSNGGFGGIHQKLLDALSKK